MNRVKPAAGVFLCDCEPENNKTSKYFFKPQSYKENENIPFHYFFLDRLYIYSLQ